MQVSNSIKAWLQKPNIKVAILVFLIALLTFGIGYIVGRDWTPAPIVIEQSKN